MWGRDQSRPHMKISFQGLIAPLLKNNLLSLSLSLSLNLFLPLHAFLEKQYFLANALYRHSCLQ